MSNSFLSETEIKAIGFKSAGKALKISRFARFYNAEQIIIGDYSRIDDFCLLSGQIEIGKYVHISAFSALYGKMGIRMGDFSGLSPRCTIFSAMDDFSGNYMIGPELPKTLTNITGGIVHIEKHVQIGAGSVVFPNLVINEGTVVGAMSLVNMSLPSWGVFAGIPCSFKKERKTDLLYSAQKIVK